MPPNALPLLPNPHMPEFLSTAVFAQADGALAQLSVLAQAEGVAAGPYLAWWKILILLVLFMVWARLLLWVDKDSDNARMPREAINSGMWGLLFVALVLTLVLPFFILSLAAFVVIFAISIGGYLIWRKQVVGLDDIPDQLSAYFTGLATFGKKSRGPTKKKDEAVELGMVTLLNAKGDAPPAPDAEDPKRVGYETAHRVLADPLYRNAERIAFVQVKARGPVEGDEAPGDRYGTKYTVDGYDYAGAAYDATSAIAAVQYLKELAGLDPNERRKVQKGKLKARLASGTHELDVVSSGTRTGESMLIEVDTKQRYRDRATALGMSQQQRDVVAEVVEDRTGIALLAAPPGGGRDALFYGMILEHDAFTQHIITMERPILRELEGVTQQTLPENADSTEEQKQFSWIADQQPDVFATDRITTRASVQELLRLARDEKRVYIGLRAPDTATALEQWIKLIGDPRRAMDPLRMVVAGRVLRKLCDACKIPYEPGEAALAKMGVPKGRVTTLYKARTEPILDQRGNPVPCEFCGQLGYKGRIGAFEVLWLNDTAKAALANNYSPAAVRQVLRNQKLPTLNEAALRQVVAGNTDLQEVQRVMSATGASRSASRSSSRPTTSGQSPSPSPAGAAS